MRRGGVTSYGYGQRGLLTTETFPGPTEGTRTYTYDAIGRFGVSVARSYDSAGRQTDETVTTSMTPIGVVTSQTVGRTYGTALDGILSCDQPESLVSFVGSGAQPCLYLCQRTQVRTLPEQRASIEAPP